MAEAPLPDQAAGRAVSKEPPAPAQVAAGVQFVGRVIAQTTVVLAVLYYFGWARSYALFDHLGIDPALLRWTAVDYALRSVGVVVGPLAVIGMVVLGSVLAHRFLSEMVRRRRSARVLVYGCALTGGALLVAGLLGYTNKIVYSESHPVVPLLLAAGVVLVFYAVRLVAPPTGIGLSVTSALLAVLAGALALWTVGVYAVLSGQEQARRIVEDLGLRPSVVVYSKRDLGLSGPRVRVEHLTTGTPAYPYRYSGLRLLIYSNGRYLLMPDHWIRYQDPIVILDESDDLRFELR